MQFGIDAYGRCLGDRSCIPPEFNDIEKSAGRVPPYDLPHGGCNFHSGQIAPTDHPVPSAFPPQRAVLFSVVLAERAERCKTPPDHGHGRPSIKGFRGSVPILNDAVLVAHDHAFRCEIGQLHSRRRRVRAFASAGRGLVNEAIHRKASPVHRQVKGPRASERTANDERVLRC